MALTIANRPTITSCYTCRICNKKGNDEMLFKKIDFWGFLLLLLLKSRTRFFLCCPHSDRSGEFSCTMLQPVQNPRKLHTHVTPVALPFIIASCMPYNTTLEIFHCATWNIAMDVHQWEDSFWLQSVAKCTLIKKNSKSIFLTYSIPIILKCKVVVTILNIFLSSK